jgi:hypothetical protein
MQTKEDKIRNKIFIKNCIQNLRKMITIVWKCKTIDRTEIVRRLLEF